MKYLYNFYKRIFFLLVIYSFCRVSFYIFNSEQFTSNVFLSFIEGIRFDISALIYINIPILILLLFPTNLREKTLYKKLTNILFYIVNIPFILMNTADIEYFKFSQKRITFDFIDYLSLGGGSDAFTVIPQYIFDYWYVSILFAIQLYFLFKIKQIPSERIEKNYKSVGKYIGIFLVSCGIFILCARGGTQYKPIKPIDAGIFSNTNNSILVLNSPFCFLHTINEHTLIQHNYFTKEDLTKIYNTKHQFESNNFEKKNVVIIILESFSKEFVGHYNNGNGYTPFLDSLISHSLVVENAYSNGIKSIEALPAITASIPSLMDNSFITSPYGVNNFESIASILKEEGYSSSFFHGGTKGTMGFYQFSKKAGFEEYFGMEEYNNENDFDGTWGIYDGPFFNYFSDYLNGVKQPFVSSIFSLSSHPPYYVPSKFENTFPKGDLIIHETIGYTDFVLKEFFEKSSHNDWYKNTLFIITADHTSPESKLAEYKNKIGRYSIPLIFFMGDSSLKGSSETIIQQIDILPTILDLIGYNKIFFSFGKSVFSNKSWAISFINNEYMLVNENGFLIGRNEEYKNYSDRKLKTKTKENLDDINLLKSIKQQYNNKMIGNKLQKNEN